MNCADCAFLCFAAIGSEAGKIMRAGEMVCCPLQNIEIERARNLPGTAVFKWRQNRRRPDSVAIDFSLSRNSRVKLVRHISAAHHANCWKQQRIERFGPTRGCQKFANIDVRALLECMNACIRASGSVNMHWPACDALKGMLEMILDRVAMRLTLPAGKRRAVISHD